ncbi:MAG: chromate transporter [Clostridia bacterium]|nr:chromate transporter [Clostridia bacterium]MBR6009540.1 chromate transporter [Clostridia bacterium]
MTQLLDLFLMFFKIGAFTFGGGYAMLPLIQEEVASRGLMSVEELVSFVAISESTPGPFAINIATYVGMHHAGIWGSVFSTLGVVMPSFIIILIVAHFFEKFKTNRIVKGLMSGLRPAVVGLLAAAVVTMGRSVFFRDGWVFDLKLLLAACIFALTLYLSLKKKHPILLIVLAAALGMAGMYIIEG